MNIHQISVNYVQEQDRCLVRINSHDGDELRLWFTRRLTLGLMPFLNKTAGEQLRLHTSPSTAAVPMAQRRTQMLESFQKEAEVYQGDFKTPFKPEPTKLPLGAEPLLITEIKLALQANGKVDLQLIETSGPRVRNIALAMNPQLMQGLLHLLAEAVKKSQWQELPPVPPELAMAMSDALEEPTALLQSADRPKYLN
jgi:hypothetical protein